MTRPAQLADRRSSEGVNAVAVAISLLLTSFLGAAQALLLAFLIPDEQGMDAFFAAYSVYLPFAMFAASMRASVIPLLGPADDDERRFANKANGVLASASLAGLGAAAAVVLAIPLLVESAGSELSPSDQQAFVFVLLLLIPAGYMHIHAALLGSVLAAVRDFRFSAVWYPLSAAAGVGISMLLAPSLGAPGAALGVLAGTVLLAGTHTRELRPYGIGVLPWRAIGAWGLTARRGLYLAGNAALGWSMALGLAVALAALPGTPGSITAYTYAFFLVLLVLNVSSLPIGLAELPSLVELARSGDLEAFRDHVVRAHVLALALFVPLLTQLVVYSRPLLEGVFSGTLTGATVQTMCDVVACLSLLALSTLVLQLGHAAAIALLRWRVSLAVCAGSILGLIVILWSAAGLSPLEVAMIHSGTVACAAVVLVAALFRRDLLTMARTIARCVAPAVILAFVCALPRLALGDDPSFLGAIVAATCGLLCYLALAYLLWPAFTGPARAALQGRHVPSAPSGP